MTHKSQRQPMVVIIGAGMTGILAAIKLQEQGISNFVLLEKKSDLGGTWRENRYPGVACDIPAPMYSYSFAPNPEWKHRFAEGAEIQAYLRKISDSYGITRKIRFQEAVVSCHYQRGRWQLSTSSGQNLMADFVISATGILHHPAKPDIKGLSSFQGSLFHTAEWDEKAELHGKRVGIIGTGSTAAQVIPELAKIASKLSIFQRTAQWIVKVPDTHYGEWQRFLWRRLPWLAKLQHRLYTKSVEWSFSNAVIGKKLPFALLNFLCRRNLKRSISDPKLRAKLTPDYRVGCKRVIVNASFYEAVQKPSVDLIVEGIAEVKPDGVLTRDGAFHPLDALILATGFHPFSFMRPMDLRGKDGLSIDEAWSRKVQAYRSLFVPGFPNFFLMLGPNTPIGNFSVIAMSEVQVNYVIKIIRDWQQEAFDAIDAKPKALQEFNAYLKKGMGKTVWMAGCKSWYLDADGDPAMWPYSWRQWVSEMRAPDYEHFTLDTFEARASPGERKHSWQTASSSP